MVDTIYVEEDIIENKRADIIISKFKNARVLTISRFTELFNLKRQNFRLQKRNPALIIAKKRGQFVLPAPIGFGIGGQKSFYFSHMYNCLYDCSYCFLQGLYTSANYVIFINYEEFMDEIIKKSKESRGQKVTFFSGYDCDSLAFEKVTGFTKYFLPKFKNIQNCEIELRTKSINVETIKSMDVVENCIVAFSLSPEEVANSLDIYAPSINKRLEAMRDLSQMGWKIGLRFDPLIYCDRWDVLYANLFKSCFTDIDENKIHSVSYGPLRFPKQMYKKVKSDRPSDRVLLGPFELKERIVAYKKDIENEMGMFCEDELSKYVERQKIFHCVMDTG